MRTGKTINIKLGTHTSIFQVKLVTITVCIEIVVQKENNNKRIYIMTNDRRATIEGVWLVKTQSEMDKRCTNVLVSPTKKVANERLNYNLEESAAV